MGDIITNSSTEFTCEVEFAFSAISRTARSVPPQESTAWKPDDVCGRWRIVTPCKLKQWEGSYVTLVTNLSHGNLIEAI